MKLDVISLDREACGSLDVAETVFGLELRKDILFRVVKWQLAKRHRGTHKTKERNEISRTGSKLGSQKGRGTARHGSRRSNIFVGGGVVHGPRVRSHSFSLPKKVRSLGLRLALSSKAGSGDLVIVDDLILSSSKTKYLKSKLDNLGIHGVLIIDGYAVDEKFLIASKNLHNVDVLPAQGANVYDILKHDKLVVTKAGIAALEARLVDGGHRE